MPQATTTAESADCAEPGATGLQRLRGVDIAGALDRLGGSEDRYQYWLRDFVTHSADFIAQLHRLLADGDTNGVSALAHAFKGRTGMAGMTALSQQAAALETAAENGGDLQALQQTIGAAVDAMCVQVVYVLGMPVATASAPLPAGPAAASTAGRGVPEKIVWSEAYSVGIAALDAQHRGLIGMINSLADCCAQPSGASVQAFHRALSGMFDYAQTHFRDEEDYLRQIGFPGLAAHQREHAVFAEKVTALSHALTQDRPDQVGAYHFLKNWLLQHILESDQQYRRHRA